MPRLNFDFHYTCPDIDKNIRDFENDLESEINDIIVDISPKIPQAERLLLAEKYSNSIYKSAEMYFENVRKTNENMREEAEAQIQRLLNQVEELEQQVKELERENAKQDQRIDELENLTT